MTIGERVFFLLDKYGLQQKELADAINVSKATVNGWKIRKGSPSADLISPIAKFFHVSTDFLLTGEERLSVLKMKNGSTSFIESRKTDSLCARTSCGLTWLYLRNMRIRGKHNLYCLLRVRPQEQEVTFYGN